MSLVDTTVQSQVEAVRNRAGIWRLDDRAFIRITGRDAAQWLHTQTTNDVAGLESGSGNAGALLDRKAYLQAHFTLHRWEDENWLLLERRQVSTLLERFDAALFLEEVRIEDASENVAQIFVQGPRSAYFLSTLVTDASGAPETGLPSSLFHVAPVRLLDFDVIAIRQSTTGEDGFLLIVESGNGAALFDQLMLRGRDWGIGRIDEAAREILRIEAGIPRFGIDMDASNRLPETTLERYCVSYDKGCYLGQEVVAKMRTYSSPKRALMGLVYDGAVMPAGAGLAIEGKPAGEARSGTISPTLERTISLAYLDRDYRVPGNRYQMTVEGLPAPITAEVVALPFFTPVSREERARSLYTRALELFDADAADEDVRAIDLLRESIALDPAYAEAYEALGVILHRHGRVDEAIQYMKILAQIAPDNVMAHTNLSVFYVSKGMIHEAEQEKAAASILQMHEAHRVRTAEEMATRERDRIRKEAADRIGMFREVLEIDPDDALATFGTGMAYVQLERPLDAIPFLKRAAENQKDYSAAYLNLGKCLEATGQHTEAAAVYRAGIAAANRKGDLMPMREMERRLKGLE